MKYGYAYILIILLFSFGTHILCQNPEVRVIVSSKPEKGWMAEGYGMLYFDYRICHLAEGSIFKIAGTWYVNNDSVSSWDLAKAVKLEADTLIHDKLVAWMPTQVAELSRTADDAIPELKGHCYLAADSDTTVIPFKISIPISKLETPLIAKNGKYIAIELQEKTWKLAEHHEVIVDMMDDTYLQMKELTGNTPYKGELIAFRESPENPYFAYAGNPIIFNEKYVPNSIKRMAQSEFDFGWVHELGHDFDDEVGSFYNFGTFTEFMANIKLSYTLEKLVIPGSDYKMKSWVDTSKYVSGKAFNTEYFLPYGDQYLGSERTWQQMKSDEYHALFYSLIQKHGWKIMIDFFHEYQRLMKCDFSVPESNKEKLELICAVLAKCTPEDVLALFETYRLPVSQEIIQKTSTKYKL